VDGVAWVGSALGLERRKLIGATRPLAAKENEHERSTLGQDLSFKCLETVASADVHFGSSMRA
jgi:hypothetical protein